MQCPYCRGTESKVVDSRDVNNGEAIRRRRQCASCGRRFTTYERIETAQLIVVKKDGRREEFNPAKLRNKLRVALTKRPVGEGDLDAIINRVEQELLAKGTMEVPSHDIGEAVLNELKRVDHVGYIRFASVYREFRDADDVQRELEGLRDRGE